MAEPGDRARAAWAAARLHVWPETYVLASLPLTELAAAAALVGSRECGFAALVVERDEVSVTLDQDTWQVSRLARVGRSAAPYRVLTIDIDVELDVCGFLAPVAVRLGQAGVSIVPQCAFRKDHVLVRATDLSTATQIIEAWIAECALGR